MDGELRALEQKIWDEAGEEFNVNSPVKLGQILFEKLELPRPEEDREDEVLFDRRRGPDRARRAGAAAAEARPRVPRDLEAQGHVRRRAAGARRRARAASTRRSGRTSRRPGDSPRRTRTFRTSRSAPRPAARSARPSWRRRARSSSSPTTRRSSCASWRTCRATRRSSAPSRRSRTSTARPPRRSSASRRTSSATRCASPPSGSTSRCSTAWRAFTLGKELGVSTSEAKSYVDSYFAQFPSVRACLDGILDEARRTKEVTTLFGRVRPIPDIAASNGAVRANAERMALNAPVPGHGGRHHQDRHDPPRRRARRRPELASRLVLQVHDELVLEAPEERGRRDRATSCGGHGRRRAAQGTPRRRRRLRAATGSRQSDARSAKRRRRVIPRAAGPRDPVSHRVDVAGSLAPLGMTSRDPDRRLGMPLRVLPAHPCAWIGPDASRLWRIPRRRSACPFAGRSRLPDADARRAAPGSRGGAGAASPPCRRPTSRCRSRLPSRPTALRIRDLPSITVEKLPTDNPYGKTVESARGPAAEARLRRRGDAGRVLRLGARGPDRQGRSRSVATAIRSRRSPPSPSSRSRAGPSRRHARADSRSTRGARTGSTSQVEIRAPKITQMTLTPVTPPRRFRSRSTGSPTPTGSRVATSPRPHDGSVPIDQVDTAPIPQKTPWSADSYKGPFSVAVLGARRQDRTDHDARFRSRSAIPCSSPTFARSMGGWMLRPAQSAGAPVDSWNELVLGGTDLLLGRHQADRRAAQEHRTLILSGPLRGPTDERGNGASRILSQLSTAWLRDLPPISDAASDLRGVEILEQRNRQLSRQAEHLLELADVER